MKVFVIKQKTHQLYPRKHFNQSTNLDFEFTKEIFMQNENRIN